MITGFSAEGTRLHPTVHYEMPMELGLAEIDRERVRAYLIKSRLDRRPDDLLPTLTDDAER